MSQLTVHQIANYFVAKAIREGDEGFTPMKLQKILYYTQGWHLAQTGEPIFDARIEAWTWGPVIPEIYYQFRTFGGDRISKEGTELSAVGSDITEVTPRVPARSSITVFLDSVWKIYHPFTGTQLSNKTHKEGTPWHQIVKSPHHALATREAIPHALLQQYFIDVREGKRKD